MILEHATKHRWQKDVVPEPETLYGKKNAKRIISTLNHLHEYDISHTIEPLSEDFLEWFTPMYVETIGSRNNAHVHDLYKATLGSQNNFPYIALTLFENQKRVGGTILSLRDTWLSVAFRVYPFKWETGTLQANPSLYTEYIVSKYAYELGKDWLSHGRDRNPYGVNANIGLAVFKLSVGCKAVLPKERSEIEMTTTDTNMLETDALILHYPEDHRHIQKATLVTSKEDESKYNQLLSYPEQIEIETIYR